MDTKEMVVIRDSDGTTMEVELVTYLISEDNSRTYMVYSRGEKMGEEEDEVLYISRIEKKDDVLVLTEIVDEEEWLEVQRLLKKIANA